MFTYKLFLPMVWAYLATSHGYWGEFLGACAEQNLKKWQKTSIKLEEELTFH